MRPHDSLKPREKRESAKGTEARSSRITVTAQQRGLREPTACRHAACNRTCGESVHAGGRPRSVDSSSPLACRGAGTHGDEGRRQRECRAHSWRGDGTIQSSVFFFLFPAQWNYMTSNFRSSLKGYLNNYPEENSKKSGSTINDFQKNVMHRSLANTMLPFCAPVFFKPVQLRI